MEIGFFTMPLHPPGCDITKTFDDDCCQSAKVGQIGTRENCCYGEAALSFLTVRL